MEIVVAKETADKEISDWLDYKKVSDTKREAYKDSIDALSGFVSDGSLTVKEDKTLAHTLKFPVGGNGEIKEFAYKPRITMSEVHKHLQGIKANDADGRVLAYIAALTGQPKNIIKALDTEDNAVAQAIAIFFV